MSVKTRIKDWWSSPQASTILLLVIIGLLSVLSINNQKKQREVSRLVEQNARIMESTHEITKDASNEYILQAEQTKDYEEMLSNAEDEVLTVIVPSYLIN